jgi:hypothetical protein
MFLTIYVWNEKNFWFFLLVLVVVSCVPGKKGIGNAGARSIKSTVRSDSNADKASHNNSPRASFFGQINFLILTFEE